jgi:hypothetical protein
VGLAGAGVAKVLKPLIEGQPVRVIDRDGSVVEIDPSPADRLRAVEIALKYGLGTASKDTRDDDLRARIETERPVIILPELGSEWTEADRARFNPAGGSDRSTPGSHVHVSPDGSIVTVDL